MITFDNASIRIHRQVLLDGARLHIADGEKVVVRGTSGSGKSSLLKAAVGAIPLSGGTISIDGEILSAGSVAQIRARISYIGQEPVLGAEKVRDAILFPFSFKAHAVTPPSEDRIAGLLERLHLPDRILDKPCARISGGEKQRIAILRALLLDKTVFLADEITSALDPDSRAAVMAELFRPEITLLSVSHDPQWINACDRIIEIQNSTLREVSREGAQNAQEKEALGALRSFAANKPSSGEVHDD